MYEKQAEVNWHVCSKCNLRFPYKFEKICPRCNTLIKEDRELQDLFIKVGTNTKQT